MIKNVKKNTNKNENSKQIFFPWVFLKQGCFPELKTNLQNIKTLKN